MSIRMDLPMCNLKTCKYNHNAYNCFDKKSYEKCSYRYVKDDLLDAHAKIYGRDAEIKQLKAKLERSVELPCKIGDVIYVVSKTYHKDYNTRKTIKTVKVIPKYVFGFEILPCEKYILIDNPHYDEKIKLDELGKTLFLTKEEAEQKLRELEGK